MKAGIDIGSSLIKVVWRDKNEYKYFSTANHLLEDIISELKKAKIKELNCAGIGCCDLKEFRGFKINVLDGDPIENEVKFQAKGAKIILEQEKLDKFLLISIGTGVSYTFMNKDNVEKFPLGNSMGGGFIKGQAGILGIEDLSKFDKYARNGQSPDLLVKDLIPQKAGLFEGELIVANLGKGDKNTSIEEVCAGIVNCVAVSVIRDIMLLSMMSEFFNIDNVVFIGSSVQYFNSLREKLRIYADAIGKKAYFPKNGEFSLAMGVYEF